MKNSVRRKYSHAVFYYAWYLQISFVSSSDLRLRNLKDIIMTNVTRRFSSLIKNWWVTLLIGILLMAIGVIVFMHPGDSYAALSVIFGLTILLSGFAQLFLAITMPRGDGWGWFLVSAIIEVVLGIVLTFHIAMSALILPFFLGFWLLFRGLTFIGVAMDMRSAGVKGIGWTIFVAVLLIITAFIVLVFPAVGIGAIVIWLGLSFVLAGTFLLMLAYRLYRLNKHMED